MLFATGEVAGQGEAMVRCLQLCICHSQLASVYASGCTEVLWAASGVTVQASSVSKVDNGLLPCHKARWSYAVIYSIQRSYTVLTCAWPDPWPQAP